jgi:hypothetical protein
MRAASNTGGTVEIAAEDGTSVESLQPAQRPMKAARVTVQKNDKRFMVLLMVRLMGSSRFIIFVVREFARCTIMPRFRGLSTSNQNSARSGISGEQCTHWMKLRLTISVFRFCASRNQLYTFRMPLNKILRQFLNIAIVLMMASIPAVSLYAQPQNRFVGKWLFNEDLSDNTDKQVEASLKAAGEKINRRLFDRRQDRYRGGPPEQELYDRISYDRELTISVTDDSYIFTYADNFVRPVYTDNRSRSVSLTGLDEVKDFSFAHMEGDKLMVEARPRDGGFADETYRLINNGTQLQMEFYIQPKGFQVPIELKRVFDRQPAP